jgi:hypothetical protein
MICFLKKKKKGSGSFKERNSVSIVEAGIHLSEAVLESDGFLLRKFTYSASHRMGENLCQLYI